MSKDCCAFGMSVTMYQVTCDIWEDFESAAASLWKPEILVSVV